MAFFTYLKKSSNSVEDAVVTASTADANFPATNAAALPVSKPWKSLAGVTSGAKLLIDLGSALSIDTVALVNHNLRSGSTITVRAGTVTDPPGGDFSTTITYRSGLAWKLLAPAATWRYWSFQLDDSGNPDTHVRAGYAMLGIKTTLSFQIQQRWTLTPEKIVRSVENELGAPMVGAVVADVAVLGFRWEGLSKAQRNEIESLLNSLDLGVVPILFIPDTTDTEAYFGRLREGWSLSHQNTEIASIEGVEFRTDGFGLVTV